MWSWRRLLLGLLLRMLLIFLAVSFCSFATLQFPILRVLYNATTDFSEFILNVRQNWAPLTERVAEAYARSMMLLIGALGVGVLLGVPLGIISATRSHALSGKVVSFLSYLGLMTPSFLFGLAVMVFFVRYAHRFTTVQFILLRPQTEISLDPRYILAPALTLAARPVAHIAHVTATTLSEQLGQDYVRVARSKGASEFRVLWKHLWPNVASPVLRAASDTVLFSLSSLPIVEFIFSWPGVGLQVLDQVLAGNARLTSFLLVTVGATFVVFSALVEALSRWLDPRLRTHEEA